MVRTVRVDLPIDSPKESLELCKEISEKHTALGLASPLNGFLDMVEFETKRASAAQKQKDGNTRQGDSQALHGPETLVSPTSRYLSIIVYPRGEG
ncbi:MAG: hypothetical protein V4615_15455 [Bacteroidota bacterium]